jgi:polyferredoxin
VWTRVEIRENKIHSRVEGDEAMIARRQRVRRAVIFCLFLTFPVVMNYFSPALIAMGASEGIINGSFILFGCVFLSALLMGRAFCGWVCPIGGLQDACHMVKDTALRRKRLDWMKWGIWGPWMGLLIFLVIRAGGYRSIQPLYFMENGISVSEPSGYINFFLVLLIIVTLAFTIGRRGFCHTMCWMAPFMILGRKLRNTLTWPSLRLRADKEQCINCGKCTKECLMSLDVNGMVREEKMENAECILCGTCIDVCPKRVISYAFGAGK